MCSLASGIDRGAHSALRESLNTALVGLKKLSRDEVCVMNIVKCLHYHVKVSVDCCLLKRF